MNSNKYSYEQVLMAMIVWEVVIDEGLLVNDDSVFYTLGAVEERDTCLELGVKLHKAYDEVTDEGFTHHEPIEVEIVPHVISVLDGENNIQDCNNEMLRAILIKVMEKSR